MNHGLKVNNKTLEITLPDGIAIEKVVVNGEEFVLSSAEPEIEEKLYQYKCYITDKDGLQHEVVHTDDIKRVTGWEI